jgi:hypothetical protein
MSKEQIESLKIIRDNLILLQNANIRMEKFITTQVQGINYILGDEVND